MDGQVDREHRLHLRAERVAELVELLWGDSPPLGPDPQLSTFVGALAGDDGHGRSEGTVVHGDDLTHRQLAAALLETGPPEAACAHLPAPLVQRLLAAGALTVTPVSVGMAALPAAHTGAWEFDAVTGLVSFDGNAARLLGLVHRGCQGAFDVARAENGHPDDRPVVASAMAEALRTGHRYETRFRCAMPDGTYAWRASRARALNPTGPATCGRTRSSPRPTGRPPTAETDGIRWTRLVGFIAADE